VRGLRERQRLPRPCHLPLAPPGGWVETRQPADLRKTFRIPAGRCGSSERRRHSGRRWRRRPERLHSARPRRQWTEPRQALLPSPFPAELAPRSALKEFRRSSPGAKQPPTRLRHLVRPQTDPQAPRSQPPARRRPSGLPRARQAPTEPRLAASRQSQPTRVRPALPPRRAARDFPPSSPALPPASRAGLPVEAACFSPEAAGIPFPACCRHGYRRRAPAGFSPLRALLPPRTWRPGRRLIRSRLRRRSATSGRAASRRDREPAATATTMAKNCKNGKGARHRALETSNGTQGNVTRSLYSPSPHGSRPAEPRAGAP
jgi:hypothetical protein